MVITYVVKKKFLKKIKEEYGYLQETYHVKRIGIFGSVVRNEQAAASDLDILVEFDRPVSFFTFLDLEEYLSEKLGVKIDLVTKGALKDIIKDRILQETIYI